MPSRCILLVEETNRCPQPEVQESLESCSLEVVPDPWVGASRQSVVGALPATPTCQPTLLGTPVCLLGPDTPHALSPPCPSPAPRAQRDAEYLTWAVGLGIRIRPRREMSCGRNVTVAMAILQEVRASVRPPIYRFCSY